MVYQLLTVYQKNFVSSVVMKNIYSAEDINAVFIKTMDTGPSVEDMYAEVYIHNTIYIILSESPLFKTLILDIFGSIVF